MEIPLNAQVDCTDGICGRSEYVLIDPVLKAVNHLVVRVETSFDEYIVPIKVVSKTIAGTILLRCSKAKLETMDHFFTTTYIDERVPERYYSYDGGIFGMGSYFLCNSKHADEGTQNVQTASSG
jgi:hypothetical protein